MLTCLPIVTVGAGYLMDGAAGALSGLLIPLGPLLFVWLSDTR
jgi:hypothetical protein